MVPYYPWSNAPHWAHRSLEIEGCPSAARPHCAKGLHQRAWKSFLRWSFAAKVRQCETWFLRKRIFFEDGSLKFSESNQLDPIRLNGCFDGWVSQDLQFPVTLIVIDRFLG